MIIPAPDPIPLPGPVGLLQFLLVLGWFLHALPMYGLLGGSLITIVTEALGRRSEFHARLARRLWSVLPGVMGVAITFGIVPLLFLQVLYGQAFFATSVLVAWPWLSVIPALLLAYYGLYANALWGDRIGRWRLAIGLGSFLLIGWVGYQFTSHVRLIEQPALWPAIAGSPARQSFYLGRDAATVLRFLYFFTGALGLAGVLVVLLAGYQRRWGEAGREFTAAAARYGGRWGLAGLAGQVLAGARLLALLGAGGAAPGLDAGIAAIGLSGPWGVVLRVWLALTVLAAVLLVVAQLGPDPLPAGLGALALLVPALALTAVQRLWLREAALAGILEVETLPVAFQTGPFLLFAGGLLLAAVVMTWVLVMTLQRRPVQVPAAAAPPSVAAGAAEPAFVTWAREAIARLVRPRPKV
ncbi:hypothetical protein [Caldinitratiruptor microaerophilus]|uniref:Uncharacterized protein n=1 Tax=Caldinitratiruptor microaerophilus TaxID=671077 RepID=A0AA35CR72_9FIRM|nr:hypothetical protein [Caldinitratiruptor microaerophilus]BDG62305.1 hypothetical protein caldi_33950 [Caldinitratiruptor microaerophilus]